MFDVAIVGGGLAGCSAAIKLARQGWRVALFEARTYPHHKVCGEFLSPECAFLLDQLGLTDALNRLQPVPIDTAMISAPNGTAWEARLPGIAFGISRYALDDCMANGAVLSGVRLHENANVNDIHGNLDDNFRLTVRSEQGVRQIHARVVIGAHGKRSNIDRTLDREFLHQPQPFVALKAHFCGDPLPRRIELHAFKGGYCGMSEIEGGKTNVCLLVRQDVFQQSNGIPAFIEWMQTQNPRLGAWLSSAQQDSERWLSISQVPFVRKTAVENDILMAGDLAGLIVPLAGDFLAMALRGGMLAAQYAGDFLAKRISAASLRRDYPSAWRREFGARLRLGRGLQEFMLRPTLRAMGLRLLNLAPPLGNFLITHTRDTRNAIEPPRHQGHQESSF